MNLIEHNDMHFMCVTLNGKKTRLLIDTGASKSLLDISQAEKFGFNYAILSRNQYVGIGGAIDIYVVYDYKIQERHISFLGADLEEVTHYFRISDMDIVGIIGSDFLESYNTRIDFVNNKLYYNGN